MVNINHNSNSFSFPPRVLFVFTANAEQTCNEPGLALHKLLQARIFVRQKIERSCRWRFIYYRILWGRKTCIWSLHLVIQPLQQLILHIFGPALGHLGRVFRLWRSRLRGRHLPTRQTILPKGKARPHPVHIPPNRHPDTFLKGGKTRENIRTREGMSRSADVVQILDFRLTRPWYFYPPKWLRHHLPRPSNFRVREMDERDTIRDSCNAPEKGNKDKHFEVSIITLAYLSTWCVKD